MNNIFEYIKKEFLTLSNLGKIMTGASMITLGIVGYKSLPVFNEWMKRPKITVVNTTIDGTIVQYANVKKVGESKKMKDHFNYRPNILFSDPLYFGGWLTEIKTENDQLFLLLTTAPIANDIKDFSFYYIRASGPGQTFQTSMKDQYVEIIFPVYSLNNLYNSPI